ncbi:urease subunit alpha domain protein [Pseudomonas aeruginosa]|uniref:hypothetical protein n=1 Tax=Pseudomonas aeruginosa TaxID=287 RepID=UPI000E025573|nr:hypothetical protein [Pseudomonas aeruginosa]RCH25248.1 urease subunit alpha domain protein [Pseudomonas aeruginosa]
MKWAPSKPASGRPGALAPGLLRRQAELILKGGAIAASLMGDINGSIPRRSRSLPADVRQLRRQPSRTSLTFVSQAAFAAGVPQQLGLRKAIGVVSGCRGVQKTDLIHNGYLPTIEVDAQNYQVRADGQLLWCEPATCCRWHSAIPVLIPTRRGPAPRRTSTAPFGQLGLPR